MQSGQLVPCNDTYQYLLKQLDARSFIALSRTCKDHYHLNKMFLGSFAGEEIKQGLFDVAQPFLKALENEINVNVNKKNKKIDKAVMVISAFIVLMEYISFSAITYQSTSTIFDNKMLSLAFTLVMTAALLANMSEQNKKLTQPIGTAIKQSLGMFAFNPQQKKKDMLQNKQFLTLQFKL